MPATKKPRKTLSARVSPLLYDAAHHLAEARGETVNQVIEKALVRELRIQEERTLYDAFTLLGQDAADADVGFALEAQAEVSLRG